MSSFKDVHHQRINHLVASKSTATAENDDVLPKTSDDKEAFARLLWINQCYEAMPSSSKMVVFDQGLIMHKAFNGLLAQSTRHVLLSDPELGGKLDGILSVTDFIKVMLKIYREKAKSGSQAEANELDVSHIANEEIGNMTIRAYREILEKEGNLRSLVSVDASASLLDAACVLAENRVHRIPVIDPLDGSALFILTHKRILKFLWLFGKHFAPLEYLHKSPKELGIGTWSGIRVVFPDTQLVDCLDILLNKGVSGLPVVERETFKVVDMYSRFDAVGIALENRLDITVKEALAFKSQGGPLKSDERVVSVRDNESFWKAVNVLVDHNVHRLCAVNEQGGIEGVISLSDVINFMVVQPGSHLRDIAAPKKHWTRHHNGDMNDKDLREILLTNAANFEQESNSSSTSDSGSNLQSHANQNSYHANTASHR
uniref:CBS domain-containing protein n=1 Tax=Caenorhabditis japonica TaxID=281687 RepID=A0A8R1DUD2_CAEJA